MKNYINGNLYGVQSKKTYSYGTDKKNSSQEPVNTGLKIIKIGEDLFFNRKSK